MRSYERQGVDRIPQIHMGPAVYQMEKRGIHTFIGDINRSIQKMNDQIQQIREAIERLRNRVEELRIYLKEVLESVRKHVSEEPLPITIDGLLNRYLQDQEEQSHHKPEDYDDVMHSMKYMKEHRINYVPDIHMALDEAEYDTGQLCYSIGSRQERINEIASYFHHRDTFNKYRDVYRQYQTQFFKTAKEKFYRSHKKEIDAYRNSQRKLNDLKRSYSDNKIPWKSLKNEYDHLTAENKGLARKLSDTKNHIKELETALQYIDQVKKNHPIKETEKTISIRQTREKRIIRTHDLEL
ncbi:MAG: hypothetical protein IIY45_10075, partial [Firmicutes bacterium]|nr:hypothetical protein [Bacillota bacterium]